MLHSLCDFVPFLNGFAGLTVEGNTAVYGGGMYIASSQETCGDPDNCFMVGRGSGPGKKGSRIGENDGLC
jgi:hypothetical protein